MENILPRDLLKELKKLRWGQDSLEKELLSDYMAKKCAAVPEMKDVETFYRKEHGQFLDEELKIIGKLNKLKGSISYFRSTAESAKDFNNKKPSFVMKTVKTAMEDVETFISGFKESQASRFNELSNEEKLLEQEVTAFDRKIELWSRTPNTEVFVANKSNKVITDYDIVKDLPPEVAQYQQFVDENGGTMGGWDAEDHELFLKHWSDLKNDETLLSGYSGYLPTRTDDEILDHVHWYRRYMELLSVKKDAIAKWKEQRKVQQKEHVEAGKKLELEVMEYEAARKAAAEEKIIHERQKHKQQLNAWRVERELERLRIEEQKRLQETEKQVKAEQNRMRQVEMKERLKQVQEEKKRQCELEKYWEEEEKRLEEEAKKVRVEANRPRVELRNLVMMEEKQERERLREAQKLERQQRIKSAAEKLKPQVPRDPGRVVRPTKGWQHRVRSAEPSSNRNMVAGVASIPHRAVPSWRQ